MAQTHSLQLASASSQYASIADASQTGLDLTTAFTIEAWINPTSLPTSGNIVGLVTKDTGGASNRSYSIDLQNNAGAYRLRVFTFASPGTPTNYSWSYVDISSYIATGVPIFIAVTFNGANAIGTRFEFFLNGLSLGNGTAADVGSGGASIYNSTTAFVIGDYSGGSQYYNGLIKDVRVFNDVRTASEIAADAHTQNVSDANLQGEWNFNNAYTDTSGNGNTLTGSGTPTFSTTIPWEGATQISGSTYLATNLAAYYELEETTGTRVDSHASYDLTDNNSVGSDTGIQGTAADFGTANTNKTLTNSSLYQTGNFAISLWFRNNTEVSAGYTIAGLMAMSDNTTILRNILLNYNYNGGSPTLSADYHKNNTTDIIASWASGYLGTSAWTHVVVTYDGTYLYLYANGVLRATVAASGGGSGSVGNQGFNLGLTARFGGSYASVDIDEVPVYSRHLHYGDVLDLYNAGAGIPYIGIITLALSEIVTIVDTAAKQGGKVLAEVATIVDSVIKTPSRLFSEVVTIVDSILATISRAFSEIVTIVDTKISIVGRSFAESTIIVDTFAFLKLISASFSDIITVTDSLVKQMNAVLSETVIIVDSFIKDLGRILANSVTIIVDTFDHLIGRPLSETLTILDVTVVPKITARVLSEVVTITDGIIRTVGKVLSDIVTIVDTFVKSIAASRAFVEVVTITDSLIKTGGKVLSEVVTIVDVSNFFTKAKGFLLGRNNDTNIKVGKRSRG